MTINWRRVPWALAAGLLAACSGARDQSAGDTSSTAPASAVEPAPTPAASAPALADALLGEWQPMSNVYATVGPLTLAADRLDWSACSDVPFTRVPGEEDKIALQLAADNPCRVHRQPVSHLLLKRRATACEIEVNLFTSAQSFADGEPDAWGVYFRERCQD